METITKKVRYAATVMTILSLTSLYNDLCAQTTQSAAKKVTIDHFNVEKINANRMRMTVAASGDNFRYFFFQLDMMTDGCAQPTGFFSTGSGFTFLNADQEGGQSSSFTLDHPLNESKNPNKFVYTFNTTEWAKGRYLLIVNAIGRPSTGGGFEVERKVFYIDVGTPIPTIVSNIPSARHQLVYSKESVYAAFPTPFIDDGQIGITFSTKTTDRHVDNTGGSKTMLSSDEGKTWVDTDAPLVSSAWRRSDGSMVRALHQGWLYADISEEPRLIAERRHPHRSSDTQVAWLGGPCVKVSTDDGRSWNTTILPMPEYLSGVNGYHDIAAYLHTSTDIRLAAIYGKKYAPGNPEKLGPDEVFIIRSIDDGYTWETYPMYPDGLPNPAIGFNETALVETAGGKILAIARSTIEDGLWQMESGDGGLTWNAPVKTPMKGFPAHVIRLKDGRLLCAYGVRRQAPQGIRAVVSADDGKTWNVENELIIRGDAAGNPADMGYPILYQRADGTILVVYYLTTDGTYPSIWSTTFTL